MTEILPESENVLTLSQTQRVVDKTNMLLPFEQQRSKIKENNRNDQRSQTVEGRSIVVGLHREVKQLEQSWIHSQTPAANRDEASHEGEDDVNGHTRKRNRKDEGNERRDSGIGLKRRPKISVASIVSRHKNQYAVLNEDINDFGEHIEDLVELEDSKGSSKLQDEVKCGCDDNSDDVFMVNNLFIKEFKSV